MEASGSLVYAWLGRGEEARVSSSIGPDIADCCCVVEDGNAAIVGRGDV